MGVSKHTLRILDCALQEVGLKEGSLKLALLGDLVMRHLGNTKANNFFRRTWSEVLSFDINGRADVKINLGLPIRNQFRNYFNVLINGGTAEHVKNQQMFFDNCHAMIKSGGILLHVAPEVGSFKNHSHYDYYYDLDYFADYADRYGYKIISVERVNHGRQGWAIYSAFRR